VEIAVGRLVRARGNRGELIAEIYSSHPDRADHLKQVSLELEGRRINAVIDEVWYHDGKPVLRFAGIDSIDEAEAWAGADILVPESERVALEDGEFYYADLIGCSVVGEKPVGVVIGIEEFGGPTLLKVKSPDGKEILIPFAKAICRQIDVAGRKIVVELPEGLLDLP
jgi:16S rRNA processing protein RimM